MTSIAGTPSNYTGVEPETTCTKCEMMPCVLNILNISFFFNHDKLLYHEMEVVSE